MELRLGSAVRGRNRVQDPANAGAEDVSVSLMVARLSSAFYVVSDSARGAAKRQEP